MKNQLDIIHAELSAILCIDIPNTIYKTATLKTEIDCKKNMLLMLLTVKKAKLERYKVFGKNVMMELMDVENKIFLINNLEAMSGET